MKYVLMDYPLSFHKLAFRAAEAAHCAGDQGKYWEMHDRLFANQKALEPWNAHAEAVGIDVVVFEKCMNDGTHADGIRKDMMEARKAGVTGTPVSFLAYTEDGSTIQTVARLPGAQPYVEFKKRIDKLLADRAKEETAKTAAD